MTETVERMLPLYEGKMIHHYDLAWATYESDGSIRQVEESEKESGFLPLPRYWLRESVCRDRVPHLVESELLGFRNIARSTDERTIVNTVIRSLPAGNSLPLLRGESVLYLQAVWTSFAFDYVARQKLGSTTTNFFILMQLPVPHTSVVEGMPDRSWFEKRSETLNSWRILGKVRARVRCEVDAAVFHLYGVARDDVDYIMETFPIVKRKDLAAHGEYRTKRMILEIYDEMAEAMASDATYVSPFDEELADD